MWASTVPFMAFSLTTDMFWFERKLSPSKFCSSFLMKKSCFGRLMLTTVSNMIREPSWMNCPRECRSVEKVTEEG